MLTLADLFERRAQPGAILWLGTRPAKRAPMQPLQDANLTDAGFEGDRSRAGKRALTLIQAEHLSVIAALSGHAAIAPEVLRRNVVVSGLNLAAFKGKVLTLGAAHVRLTVICAPCSRMEEALGHGGYNAVRGHGGWCAEVLQPGHVQLGDPVDILAADTL